MSRVQSLPVNFFYYFDYERVQKNILEDSHIFEELSANQIKFMNLQKIYDSNFESEYFEVPQLTLFGSSDDVQKRQEYIKYKIDNILEKIKKDIGIVSAPGSAVAGSTIPGSAAGSMPPAFFSPFLPDATLGIKKIKLRLANRTEKLSVINGIINISLDCDYSKDMSRSNDEKKINDHFKDEFKKLNNLLERERDKTIEVYVPMIDRDVFSFFDRDLEKLYKKGNNMLYFKTALKKFISSQTSYNEGSKYEHPRIFDIVYGRAKKLCEEYRNKDILFNPRLSCTSKLNEFWYVCYFIQQLYNEFLLKKPKLKMVTILDVNTKEFTVNATKKYSEVDEFDYTFPKDKSIIDERKYKYFVVRKTNNLRSDEYSNFSVILEDPLTYLVNEVSGNDTNKKVITLEAKLHDPMVYVATVENENEKGDKSEKRRGLFAKKEKTLQGEDSKEKKLGIQDFIRNSSQQMESFYYIPGFLFSKEDVKKYQSSLKSEQPFHQFLATLLTKKQNISKFYIYCQKKLNKKYKEHDGDRGTKQSKQIMKKELHMLLEKNTPFYVKRVDSTTEKESEYNIKSRNIQCSNDSQDICKVWNVNIELYKKTKSTESKIKGNGCDASKSRVFGSMQHSARGVYIGYLLRTLRGGIKKVKKTRKKKKYKKTKKFKKTRKYIKHQD